jgi:bifunctional DNase/RNase
VWALIIERVTSDREGEVARECRPRPSAGRGFASAARLTQTRPARDSSVVSPGPAEPQSQATQRTGTRRETTTVAVQMELTRIIINENNDQQIIFLKEVDGERTFPIVIGVFEATSIDRRVKGLPAPRPLTHDLLANAIELLGGELQDIYINELRDHTYYAKLRIRHDGEIVEVDSRPSDAIAVAVTVDVPIYVSEEVLDEVGH